MNAPAMGSPEQRELLNEIRAYSFAALESALYLDGYYSPEALEYHQKMAKKSKEAKEKYESLFGPLTQSGVVGDDGWTWVKTPWPWELEAN
ncbi:MAG: spore coat protein CotJB [Eubacteriales bacterium]